MLKKTITIITLLFFTTKPEILFTNKNIKWQIPCESYFLKETFYLRSLFYKTFENACSSIRKCYSNCNILTTQKNCEKLFLFKFQKKCENEKNFQEGCKRFVKRWVDYLQIEAIPFYKKKQNECKNVQICTKSNGNKLIDIQKNEECLNSDGLQNKNLKQADFFRIIPLNTLNKSFMIQSIDNLLCFSNLKGLLILEECDESNKNQRLDIKPGENLEHLGDFTLKIDDLCLTHSKNDIESALFKLCDFRYEGIDWYLFDEKGYTFPIY